MQPEGEGWPLDMGCWQKAGRSCRAAAVLLGQTAVGRGWGLWGGAGGNATVGPEGRLFARGQDVAAGSGGGGVQRWHREAGEERGCRATPQEA